MNLKMMLERFFLFVCLFVFQTISTMLVFHECGLKIKLRKILKAVFSGLCYDLDFGKMFFFSHVYPLKFNGWSHCDNLFKQHI